MCWIRRECGFPIEDESYEVYQVAGIAKAKSDRSFEVEQKARNVAQTSNRIKEEFLATLGHVLWTLLNSSLNWSKMLCSGNLNPATVARYLLERLQE